MRRRSAAVVLLAVLAVVGAFMLGRLQAPQVAAAPPSTAAANAAARVDEANATAATKARTAVAHATAALPPRDTPLKDAFGPLQARANAGDVAAATRLYRDVSLCSRFRGMDWANARLADELLRGTVDASDPEQLRNYQVELDAIDARKDAMRKFHGLCDGVTDSMLDSLVPDLQRAAQLGEEGARACYLQRGPSYDARRLMNHPEWLDAYRTSVSSLIGAGVAQGDWKVVDVLRMAYQPGSESPLAGVLGSDPYQYYRYLKLYRLGAEPFRAEQLEPMLGDAAAQLSPAQLAEADAWAQSTYQQNFNNGNSTESTVAGWDPCSFAYEPL